MGGTPIYGWCISWKMYHGNCIYYVFMDEYWGLPSSNDCYTTMETHHAMKMGKLTNFRLGHGFNSYLCYQRVPQLMDGVRSGDVNSLLLKMAIEIVSFPRKKIGDFPELF